MTFFHSLIPTSFYEGPHCLVVCVFNELAKGSTIPQVESKQHALSVLRGIVHALGALEYNGIKNNHPLSVPLPSTEPVKLYRQNSHKYLPNFPGRCVIALGWQKNKFFPPHLTLTVFRYSSIQVVSWILVHPILVDAI